jgi:hypothetical protein
MPFYKVVYAEYSDAVQSQYRRSYKDWLVDEWLKENCRSPYYHSPGWRTNKFIEFEHSEDAVLFALRWGG